MPTTVNGIGTTYYGKKHARTFEGYCENCRRTTVMQEYETRHWFVVAFVPLIPLGRKQILDDCSRCRRHKSLPLAKWHEIREQAIADGTQKLGENPDDPQSALEFLRTLSTFSRFDEADKLASGIEQRFDDDADVQFAIGQWHDFRDRPTEAAACYRRAFRLQPDNLAAKRAVALATINEGQPSQARALLADAPAISPRMDPAVYLALGQGYARLAQHDEACAVYQQAIEAAPELGRDKEVRKLVRTSERFAAPESSLLPTTPVYRSPALIVGVALVVVLLGFFGTNYYVATHRTLHVVNGFSRPVEVQLDGGEPLTIAPHGRQMLAIAEGPHHAVVTADGKPLADDEFDVSTGFWERFINNPVFVLNAGRGAAILWEQVFYAENPVEDGTGRLEVGQPFFAFADVDFSFEEFPATIDLGSAKKVAKTRVDVLEVDPNEAFLLPPEILSIDQQLAFAEAHLQLDPDATLTLQNYMQVAANNDQTDRVRKYLATGLDALPPRVEWHRAAQELCEDEQQEQTLLKLYAGWIEQDPRNAAALYLLGRLEPRSEEALQYFERAIAADPANPYGWFAKGYRLHANGDFQEAEPAYAKAVELRPDHDDYQTSLRSNHFALGRYDEVERELRETLNDAPHRLFPHIELLEVLAAQGRLDEARRANAEYAALIGSEEELGENERQAIEWSQSTLLYLEEAFDRILASGERAVAAGRGPRQCYLACLEMGQTDAAAEHLQAESALPAPYEWLRLSIAYRMQRDQTSADYWQNRACAEFEQGTREQRQVAGALRHAADVTPERTRDLALLPHEKVTVLVALAQQCPAHRDELLALAKKLNYSRLFPHRFHERAIAATASEG